LIKKWIEYLIDYNEIITMTQSETTINKTSRWRIAWQVLLLFVFALTFFAFVSVFILVVRTKPAKEITVPDVTGKKFIDVYNLLSRKEVQPKVTFKDVADIDDGIIISQYPESGTVVKSDTRIRVTVSRSSFYVDTPNLIGLAYPIAVNKMKNLQYQGRPVSIQKGVVSYIPSETTGANIVLGQSPLGGERITPDRKINLLVSAGSAKGNGTVPDVKNQSIDLVYDLLVASGISIKQKVVVTGAKKESGIIKDQSLKTGTKIKEGSVIILTVAWYPLQDHPYSAYERVKFTISKDGKGGLYEAFIKDSQSRRLRFSYTLQPGREVDFVFKRMGNARVEVLEDKKPFKAIKIDVQ
jgi:eukaryotic-like serine/threonine-protein kinase